MVKFDYCDSKGSGNYSEKCPATSTFKDSDSDNKWSFPNSILLIFLGTILVFSILLGVGNIIYSKLLPGMVLFFIGVLSAFGIFRLWK